jgi:hypothetical protein
MTHEYTFYAEWLCKFGRTLNAILTTSSALILVALSANRYRADFEFFFWLYAFFLLILVLVSSPLSIVVDVNELVDFCEAENILDNRNLLTGLTTHDREHNLTAFDCSHAQNYINTNYPVIYSVGMLIFYILCMVSLLIMCFFIGRQIIKHMEFRDQFRLSKMYPYTVDHWIVCVYIILRMRTVKSS